MQMQRLRDNPECAEAEYRCALRGRRCGNNAEAELRPGQDIAAPYIATGARPKIAVLRDQGVNGQIEMAAVFTRAGFDAHDVHMTDLQSGRIAWTEFHGFVACGGFSYGDVLGAGRGWATSILFNPRAARPVRCFFAFTRKFALGVCNGCQMIATLRDIIPGAEHWPSFERNTCEQYEARLVTVEVLESPSIFFKGMAGSRLPIAVAHGEGRAVFAGGRRVKRCSSPWPAFRRPRPPRDGSLPAQPERLAEGMTASPPPMAA